MRIQFAALALAAIVGAIAEPTVDVYLVGDSTMADKPTPETNPERGWGQLLPHFFDEHVAIHNHAVNGRSTKSFIDEGKWGAVEHALKPGDYVFIQFGHNDEKVEDSARYAAPYTAYRKNLERFVAETRAKGATPILFTPIVRRKFNAQGTLEDTHGAYPLVVREVARDLNVALVDLQTLDRGPRSRARDRKARRSSTSGSRPANRRCTPTAIRTTRISPCSARPASPDSPRRRSREAGCRSANSCATWTPRRGRRGDPAMAERRTRSARLFARRPAGDHARSLRRSRAATGAAMLVFPGGGYEHLAWDKEGTNVARWLNTLGVSAFVVRYRLGPRLPPSDDAHRRSPRRTRRPRPRARLGHRSVQDRRHGLLGGRTHGLDRGHAMDAGDPDERRRRRTHVLAPRSGDSRVSGHHDDRRSTRTRAHAATSSASIRTINSSALRRTSFMSRQKRRRPSSSPPATTRRCRFRIH